MYKLKYFPLIPQKMIDIAQKYIVVMKNRAKYTENHME